MAQTDAQTSDAQRAIARAVAVASAQLRKEFRLRSEKQRRAVSELQQAVARRGASGGVQLALLTAIDTSLEE